MGTKSLLHIKDSLLLQVHKNKMNIISSQKMLYAAFFPCSKLEWTVGEQAPITICRNCF